MAKDKRTKPSKELPLGFVDRQETELLTRDLVITNIKQVMKNFGFQYLETPSFEYTDSIGKFLPDKDRPDEGVFSFKDGKNWLSLRYDLTAPLARYIAKNYMEIPKPFKRYQLGNVWRNEKPGPGRFREFLQFDADIIGTNSTFADAELVILVSEILKKCGLNEEDFKIRISSRKILNELLNAMKINDDKQKKTVLRSLDKLNKLSWNEVKKLLGTGRKDKSGDFTKGAGLNNNQIERLSNWFNTSRFSGDDSVERFLSISQAIAKVSKITYNETELENAFFELTKIKNYLKEYSVKNCDIDLSIVRGLEYYTGFIFEVELTFEDSKTVENSSIAGGGRYDDLVSRFDNSIVCPSTGVSIGIDRLVWMVQAKLQAVTKQKYIVTDSRPIIICNLDEKFFSNYIKILKNLRSSEINSEIYSGKQALKKQMNYANKRNSPAVILFGENEEKIGKPILRDLKTGKETSCEIENLANEIKKLF